MKETKRIIIDTNAWMAVTEFKLDLFPELEKACDFPYKITTLRGTIDELRKIASEQRAKFRQAALLAIGLIEFKKIEIISEAEMGKSVAGNGKSVDDLLVEHSKKGDLVLTQDIILKKRLKKPYLTIRQKKMIMIIN